MEVFSEDSPKYRCCCQCMHVRTGALIIGVVHDVIILMFFLRFVRVTTTLYEHTTTKWVTVDQNGTVTEVPYVPGFQDVVPSLLSALLFVASLVCVILLFWGVCKSRPKFLVPEVILLCASMFFCASAILFLILVLALDSSDLNIYVKEQLQARGHDDLPDTVRFLAKIVASVGIVVFLGSLALTYWFFRVVRTCYRYLKDKQQFLGEGPTGARFAAGDEGTTGERQPIVIIQPPSSAGGGGDGQSPPPALEK